MTGPTGATGPQPSVVGSTGAGPTGYALLGNILINWGVVNATQAGTTGFFVLAYTDANPSVTLGVSGPTGAYISGLTKDGLKITVGTGQTGPVYYHAIGT